MSARVAAFVRAMKPEDRRPVEFSVDPEDRNRQGPLPRCDEYVDHNYDDYFPYLLDAPKTMLRLLRRLLPLRPRRRLLPL